MRDNVRRLDTPAWWGEEPPSWQDEPDPYGYGNGHGGIRHGPGDDWQDYVRARDELGNLTQVVFYADDVLDVVRVPARGSEYEDRALELDLCRARRAPRVERVEVDREPRWAKELAWLERLVGSPEALHALSVEPLPADEEIDLTGVAESLHDRVAQVARRLTEACDALHEPELGIACHRVLTRGAAAAPSLLRDPEKLPNVAAAILIATGRGNGILGTGCAVPQSFALSLLGVSNAPSDRVHRWARAVSGSTAVTYAHGHGHGHGQRPDVPILGSPELLVGRFREHLVRLRDLALAEQSRHPRDRPAAKPL